MDLLEMLSDRYAVCRNHLLSFLDFNDFLRLRRTSIPFKSVAEDYIRTKKVKTSRILDIDFATSRPFEEYFEYFHYTSSFLPQRESLVMSDVSHPSSYSFSTKILLQHFLSTCATTNITNLTIYARSGYVIPLHSKTWIKFFDSFPNVTHLMLDYFSPFDLDDDDEEDLFAVSRSEPGPKELLIPTGFKKLRHLTLHPDWWLDDTPAIIQTSFAYCVKFVKHYISNLESLYLTFEVFWEEWKVEKEDVIRFACMCLFNDYNVKLLGVDGTLISELLQTHGRTPEMGTIEDMSSRINEKVVSISNPESKAFALELPNLEKVKLVYWTMPDPWFVRPEWPKLAEINVQFIDSVEDLDRNGIPSFIRLWDFLFAGIVRTNLVNLHIGYHGDDEPNDIFSRTTTDVLASCPNLKSLRLNNQIKELISLPELWRGLRQLEKLRFDDCKISDADFVGEDESSPAFWNLKRLKSLVLKGTAGMTVTDNIFSKVLCHMPLKDLSVHSTEYVNSITLDGIKGLLNGKFASTIEKLYLDLAGVSSEENVKICYIIDNKLLYVLSGIFVI